MGARLATANCWPGAWATLSAQKQRLCFEHEHNNGRSFTCCLRSHGFSWLRPANWSPLIPLKIGGVAAFCGQPKLKLKLEPKPRASARLPSED